MIVVFGEGLKKPLLLSHITWRDDKIQSAYVINGAWEFNRVNGVLCVEGDVNSPISVASVKSNNGVIESPFS